MVRIGGSAFKAINTVARTQQTLNKVKVLVVKSYVVLCNPKCYSLLGSSVHGILQARILKWIAMPFSRGSSQPRDQTQVSRIGGRCFIV